VMGHKKVVEERVEELIDHAGHLGISYITFWAFSTENWARPAGEVKTIMQLFRWAFANKAMKMVGKGAKLRVIGDMSKFDKDIREGIAKFEKASKKNTKITVTFALNYGGRDEILRAVNKAVQAVRREQAVREVRAEDIEACLDTAGMPDPDLIIRTSGEQRLSGFMPWQSVYSEFYFTKTLMPDFDSKEFDLAMEDFQQRQRRMGR